MNHLIIRTDATESIGIGHFMRCVALAQAWKKQGGLVTFITCCFNNELLERLTYNGFNINKIKNPWPCSQDLTITVKIVNRIVEDHPEKSVQSNWIVLDGYHFTPDYQKTIKASGFNLLVLDDYNHLDYYYADIILNQNISSNAYHYCCPKGTRLLLGTKYLIIRSEFLNKEKTSIPPPERAKKILITMGGADPDNITSKILQIIKKITIPDFTFHVILGPNNPNIESLQKTTQDIQSNIRIFYNPDMPKMMTWADLAITAGGSTCWELCFMGVPFMTLVLAPNQYDLTISLKKKGVSIYLANKDTLDTDQIVRSIAKIAEDKNKRETMIESGKKLVDGKGTKRIIRQMLVEKIHIRPAGIGDAKQLFEWVNDKDVRLASFNPSPVLWESHLQWLQQKLHSKNSYFFIGENHLTNAIGQIRFDLNSQEKFFEISYSLDKRFRGLGLGKFFLKAGLEKLRTKIDHSILIKGSVKDKNIASKMSFEHCGFSFQKDKSEINKTHGIYHLELHPDNNHKISN